MTRYQCCMAECRMVLCGAVLLLLLAGCDQVKQLANQQPEQAPAATSATTEPAPAMPAAPSPQPSSPPVPSPKTPEQVIAEFLALPTHERTEAHLKQLAELPSGLDAITVLDLTRSSVTNEGLSVLPSFTGLAELILNDTRIGTAGLTSLPRVSNLRVLSLDRTQVDSGIGPIAKECPKLAVLSLRQTPVSDAVFAPLADMQSLESLHLDGNVNLVGHEFNALVKQGKFKSLRELTAGGGQLGFYALQSVERLKQLEVLKMANSRMSDDSLQGLGQCPNLKILHLGQNQITDKGIQFLAKLRNLEELDVGGVPTVTDLSFNVLKSMKQLKVLNVTATSCTVDAAKTLKEKFLKDTSIVIDNQTL